VVMLGDNIYGTTELTHGGGPKLFPKKFDTYYKRFQDAGVVFHASVGNHDMQTDRARGEIDDQTRFGMLGPDGYYKFSTPDSFDVSGKPLAEFFALNSELHGEKFDAQVKWLAEELPKSTAVWKFVFLHHPFYTVEGQHAPAVGLRRAIGKSLHDNHVQFALGGHNHFYSRMKPADGMMQMISGAAGATRRFRTPTTAPGFRPKPTNFWGSKFIRTKCGSSRSTSTEKCSMILRRTKHTCRYRRRGARSDEEGARSQGPE